MTDARHARRLDVVPAVVGILLLGLAGIVAWDADDQEVGPPGDGLGPTVGRDSLGAQPPWRRSVVSSATVSSPSATSAVYAGWSARRVTGPAANRSTCSGVSSKRT